MGSNPIFSESDNRGQWFNGRIPSLGEGCPSSSLGDLIAKFFKI